MREKTQRILDKEKTLESFITTYIHNCDIFRMYSIKMISSLSCFKLMRTNCAYTQYLYLSLNFWFILILEKLFNSIRFTWHMFKQYSLLLFWFITACDGFIPIWVFQWKQKEITSFSNEIKNCWKRGYPLYKHCFFIKRCTIEPSIDLHILPFLLECRTTTTST